MENHRTLPDLFAQLGLPSENENIEEFIQKHRILSEELELWQAPFWSQSQAAFLHEELKADAEWTMPIDELNRHLRH